MILKNDKIFLQYLEQRIRDRPMDLEKRDAFVTAFFYYLFSISK